MIDFTLSDEQSLIVETVRDFVRRELMPHDDAVERLGYVPTRWSPTSAARASRRVSTP
jgi:alkylation response protein AidB-like acyl-CoA dehydrogenase